MRHKHSHGSWPLGYMVPPTTTNKVDKVEIILILHTIMSGRKQRLTSLFTSKYVLALAVTGQYLQVQRKVIQNISRVGYLGVSSLSDDRLVDRNDRTKGVFNDSTIGQKQPPLFLVTISTSSGNEEGGSHHCERYSSRSIDCIVGIGPILLPVIFFVRGVTIASQRRVSFKKRIQGFVNRRISARCCCRGFLCGCCGCS